MQDTTLPSLISAAAHRFEVDLNRSLPRTAPRILRWLKRVPDLRDPVGSCLNARNFPCFRIPYWLSRLTGHEDDVTFQGDLAYSTLHGYYFIRLVDNVSDGDAPAELRKLLPATAYFLTRFQGVYQGYFPSEHPFWPLFAGYCDDTAELTAEDAFLEKISLEEFHQISSRKFNVAKVPMAAAALRYGAASMIEPWSQLIDGLGRWYQLANDFFDWYHDEKHQIRTYFLTEAQRRCRPGESLIEWYAREGFDWGTQVLRGDMEQLCAQAAALGCAEAVACLEERWALFEQQQQEASSGLAGLRILISALS